MFSGFGDCGTRTRSTMPPLLSRSTFGPSNRPGGPPSVFMPYCLATTRDQPFLIVWRSPAPKVSVTVASTVSSGTGSRQGGVPIGSIGLPSCSRAVSPSKPSFLQQPDSMPAPSPASRPAAPGARPLRRGSAGSVALSEAALGPILSSLRADIVAVLRANFGLVVGGFYHQSIATSRYPVPAGVPPVGATT